MKDLFFSISVVIFILILSTTVFAGGGKVLGDLGKGEVHQEQIMDPPPFQDK